MADQIVKDRRQTTQGRIAVLLMDAGIVVKTPSDMALQRPGAQLRELAVAVPGSWVKGDKRFSITQEDLSDMERNFEKRKNDMLVIDYEHASEMPEVAKGGPVPGAGWIHGLRAHGKLTALVEWTPQAEEMLRTGQYRFFSPAIDWSAIDKETGEPQGATLTSGALTNHPFLEELPPIMLSDGKIILGNMATTNSAIAPDRQRSERGKNMKKLSLKPIPDEDEQGGNHAVFEEETSAPLGYIPHSDLTEYAARHLGVNPDQEEDLDASRGADGTKERAKAVACETNQRTFFLRETVRKGKIDSSRAAELARNGKITLAEYIRAQEAEKLIEAAVASGKILPRDRAFFFQDAIDRPREFQEYIRNASPAVRLDVRGLGSSEGLSLDEEIHLGVKQLMRETGLDYARALKQFLSANSALGEQYRRKHCEQIHPDSTAN